MESQDKCQPAADELSEAATAAEINGESGAAELPHATPGAALPVATSAAEPSSPDRIEGASNDNEDVGLRPSEEASSPLAVPAETDDAGTEERGNSSGCDAGGSSWQPGEAGNDQEEDHDRSDSQQPQDQEEERLIGSGAGSAGAAQEGGAVEGTSSTSVAKDEEGSEPGDDEGLGEQEGAGEEEEEADSSSLAGEEHSPNEERGAAPRTVPQAPVLDLDAEGSETGDAGAAAPQFDKPAEDSAESAEAGFEGEAGMAEGEAPGVEEAENAGDGGVDVGGLAESDEEGEPDGDGGVLAGEGEVGGEDDGTDGGAEQDAESLGSATPEAAPVVASGTSEAETEAPGADEQTVSAVAAAAREREDALTARLLVAEELLAERERQLESTNLAMAEIMQNGGKAGSASGDSDSSGSAAAVAEARAGGERALADLRGQHAREVSRLEGLVEAEKRKGKAAADAVRSWEIKDEEFAEKDKMLKVLDSTRDVLLCVSVCDGRWLAVCL